MENLVSIQQLSSFYNGKKIFITGHTGFKGSWLTGVLENLGAKITGYALEPEQPGGLFDYLKDVSRSISVINDIRDRKKLEKEITRFEPDLIFHLAAQPLVRRSYEIPAETFDVNVTGTANVLETAMRVPGKCSIVVVTTDKVYQNPERNVLFSEQDPLGGHDPYSTSKACSELVCDSFRKSFFDPSHYSTHQKALATARAGNVIGGGDWSRDRLIPDIVNAIQNSNTIKIRNPGAVRPWQHVLEAIAGYLILGMNLHEQPAHYSKAYNFGPLPEDHLAVQEVVESAIEIMGIGNWQNIADATNPHEATLLQLDITLAMEELQWKPKLNAKEAISWTMEWYKCPENEKMDCTSRQIEKYFLL